MCGSLRSSGLQPAPVMTPPKNGLASCRLDRRSTVASDGVQVIFLLAVERRRGEGREPGDAELHTEHGVEAFPARLARPTRLLLLQLLNALYVPTRHVSHDVKWATYIYDSQIDALSNMRGHFRRRAEYNIELSGLCYFSD